MSRRFLLLRRDDIIAAVQAKVRPRSDSPAAAELMGALPAFLDELGEALRAAESSSMVAHERFMESAAKQGGDLLQRGLTIGQVVHQYGSIRQSISDVAARSSDMISTEELRLISLCVDDATAGAVTAHARQREDAIRRQSTERLGVLVHELRTVLSISGLAYSSLQTGKVGIGGSTGQLLGRSLTRLTGIIDRSLAEVRLDVGIACVETIAVSAFVEEIRIGASMLAQARGVPFTVEPVNQEATIEGDRQTLVAAVSNMLNNAFKFTRRGSPVSLRTRVTSERVYFDVEDECGGLPPGKIENLFLPFSQRGTDRTGVGLGLSICLRAARTNSGDIIVRDLPGKGCVFTLDLPRRPTEAQVETP
jgi:signal transduction histidine kinase